MMPTPSPTTQSILTVHEWAKILSQHWLAGWPDQHHPQRRKQQRYPIPAVATLTTSSDNDSGVVTLCTKCPVLDACTEGIAIRPTKSIQPGTAVSIELHLGLRIIALKGKILRNIGFPGSYRTSILLDLAD